MTSGAGPRAYLGVDAARRARYRATMSSTARAQVLSSSEGRGWSRLDGAVMHVPRGRARVAGGVRHVVGMHVGPPVRADCSCAGQRLRRVQMSGDVDIVPAGVDGWWEDDADCRILRIGVDPDLLVEVAAELGRPAVELAPRLQLRDARTEAIGWAIKADLEAELPSDPLYVDALAHALAVRLVETTRDDTSTRAIGQSTRRLSARALRTLTDYIEGNLGRGLRLGELAAVAGMGVTQLKATFRSTTGMSVHQYVLRRRVELARSLLETTARSMSDVAIAAGFSHQSHMATTMRRLLGRTPREFRRAGDDSRPILQTRART